MKRSQYEIQHANMETLSWHEWVWKFAAYYAEGTGTWGFWWVLRLLVATKLELRVDPDTHKLSRR